MPHGMAKKKLKKNYMYTERAWNSVWYIVRGMFSVGGSYYYYLQSNENSCSGA